MQQQFLSHSTKHIFVQASMQFTCNKVVLFHETVCKYSPWKYKTMQFQVKIAVIFKYHK